MAYVIDKDQPHLGGNEPGGDPHSFFPELWAWMVKKLDVKRVLDVGCGEGHAMGAFAKLGCKVQGIDGLERNAEMARAFGPCVTHDLTKGAVEVPGMDLVWCCEVVEHIDEKFLDNLLDTICVGKWLAMTHAVPGQDGHHHVNCQPQEYWVEKLALRGYRYIADLTSESLHYARGFWKHSGLIFKREAEYVKTTAPRIFLVMPAYGLVEGAASDAYWVPATETNLAAESSVFVTRRMRYGQSSPEGSMNFLLCRALEARDRGICDHIAMLHSDACPQGPWLNILWNEKRRTGADIISAVMAIKDERGRTSTAVGDRWDRWKSPRFIHIPELANLPTTFSLEDVSPPEKQHLEVLLVNTGCWLADLRTPFWNTFCFQQHSRIRKAPGVWVNDLRPEDWEWSRDAHEFGLKVCATSAVRAGHVGVKTFPNFDTAGMRDDSDLEGQFVGS